MEFKNLYSQFIIDLPRLTLYIDGKLNLDNSETVYSYLYDKLNNKKQLDFCLYFLTQTSLADYYIKECKKTKNECEHLVDDGKYIVKLDTVLKTINVSKNFRKIYINQDTNFELDFADLDIMYDLDKKIICHSWNYEFNSGDELVMIDK